MTPTMRNDLRRVMPASLRTYLERRPDWKETCGLANGAGRYFEAAGANDAVLVLDSTRYADYPLRTAENLAILAAYEHRDTQQILEDLLASDDDLVRVRVDAPVGGATLPLSAGVTLLNEGRQLMLAAARAAERPEKAYTNRPRRQVQNYLGTVRFGHTERGSFVLPIYSPVSSDIDGKEDGDKGAFSRRVIKVLVAALKAAKSDAPRNVERETHVWQRTSDGVSANLCDALYNLIGISGGVDVSVRWALGFKAPQKNFDVRFVEEEGDRLDRMRRELTHEEEMVGIRGLVSRVARDPKSKTGRATIKADVDGVTRIVHLHDLSPTIYSPIVEAHKERKTVTAVGRLSRRGKTWFLDDSHDVEIVEDD